MYHRSDDESSCAWREYSTENGKKYYYNSHTRISVWDPPTEYLDPSKNAVKMKVVCEDKGEEAFIQLLIDRNIDESWSWDQVLRDTISNPAYRAIDSMPKRKAAYQRYLEERKKFEREEARRLSEKRKADFVALLDADPEIITTTRYRVVYDRYYSNPVFQAITSEREREAIFEEFQSALRSRQRELADEKREENIERFSFLLQSIPEVTHSTQWRRAIEIFTEHPTFKDDPFLKLLDPSDCLTVYEDHMKSLEKKFYDQRYQEYQQEKRHERQARDSFRALLCRLRDQKQITPYSQWKSIYPLVCSDSSYKALLVARGSTPQDLFFDLVDDLSIELQSRRIFVDKFILKTGALFSLDTSLDEFLKIFVNLDPDTFVSREALQTIYLLKRDDLKEQLRQERKREPREEWSREMDAFDHILQTNYPALTAAATWEQVRPAICGYPEFGALQEAKRIEVFAKRIQKLRQEISFKEDTEEGEITGADAV